MKSKYSYCYPCQVLDVVACGISCQSCLFDNQERLFSRETKGNEEVSIFLTLREAFSSVLSPLSTRKKEERWKGREEKWGCG